MKSYKINFIGSQFSYKTIVKDRELSQICQDIRIGIEKGWMELNNGNFFLNLKKIESIEVIEDANDGSDNA